MAYFCHQCRRVVNVSVTPDLHCTNCNSEFVEEMESMNDSIGDTGGIDENEMGEDGAEEGGGRGNGPRGHNGIFILHRQPINPGDNNPDLVVVEGQNPFMNLLQPNSPFSRMFTQILRQPNRSTPTSMSGFRPAAPVSLDTGSGNVGGFRPSNSTATSGANSRIDNTGVSGNDGGAGGATGGGIGGGDVIGFINQLMSNLAENAGNVPGRERTPGITRLTFQFGGPNVTSSNINVNDYAWGPEGVDAIVTQLLNQFDSGPVQNVSAAALVRLPMTKVTNQHVDNGTQCATCMDTFNLDESVARLDCQHIFHRSCIEPWLQRQNTCPICRKVVDPKTWGNGEDGDETSSAARPSTSSEFIDMYELD